MANVILKKDLLSYLFGGYRLSIVRDVDNFLSRQDVQDWLKGSDVLFFKGSQFQLRLMFELKYKTDENHKYCFIVDGNYSILPDVKHCANVVSYGVSKHFPAYNKQSISTAPVDILDKLYSSMQVKTLNRIETDALISQLEEQQDPMDSILEKLKQIHGYDLEKRLSEISECIVESLLKDRYCTIEKEIDRINSEWQLGLDERYFSEVLPSSYLTAPSYVGNILNHINANFKNEKIALVVVDGMSYWQYLILKKSFSGLYDTVDSHIHAWIPSITMLSRQAIFRGGFPIRDYKQNPQNEEKLWFEYWKGQGFESNEIAYEYNNIDNYDSSVKRLAYVTVKLDEKMHASENNRDLFSLTNNWASSFSKDIKRLKENGYTVFLTTDHGNIQATGWRKLSAQEKVYLYGDGSRGKRHLIYDDTHGMDELFGHMDNESVMRHEDWIVWRNRMSFSSEGSQEITHGGCHFLEVLIPFIKIK